VSANQWRRVFAFFDVSNPLVAWLVYRAEIVSALEAHETALSFWTTRYLASIRAGGRKADRYRTEVALDGVRLRGYPGAVSRLGGFYVFSDEESALRASRAWGGGFRRENLAELGLRPDARTSRYDSEWITHKLDPEGDLGWADAYFAGHQLGDEPIWEIVVDGRALILGTDLRETAYETVKAAWPASLSLLELARVAVELDSDLGLITPLQMDDRGRPRVRYAMNFKDAKDEAFLRRFGSFTGPKNMRDLRPDSDLVVPDLTRAQFYI
jgi:hypothetical protein